MTATTEGSRKQKYVPDLLRQGRARARDLRWYRRQKRRHFEHYQPDASRAPDRDLFDALVRDGVVVLREFLPRDVVERIAADVRGPITALARDEYSGPLRTRVIDGSGLVRLFDIEDSLSAESRAFFDSDLINDLANSLCTEGMHTVDRYADYKVTVGGWDESLDYHIDHWKLRFKVFLLLQDVTEQQAPFVYVLGSHRAGRWRARWDWGYQARGSAGAILTPQLVAKVCRRRGLTEQTFTGKAGDLILADTRGVHRGNILEAGDRLQLVSVYVMNGAPDFAC